MPARVRTEHVASDVAVTHPAALLDLPLDAATGPPEVSRDLVEVEEKGWLDVVSGVHIPLRIRGLACGPFPTPDAVFTTPV